VSATVPVFSNVLGQNAPNPFNPTTSIVYSLSDRAEVAVSIYDVAGVRVRRIDQGVRDAGEYAVEWDGRDDAGIVVGTGVYFYRLDGVSGVAPKKMVLLK
jgi:flagellar hook assembly protein FlgD